ncbi:hypothetical protein F8198_11485 [Micrococcus luteus NCTC 2665]|nr:hypothetical protein F8198_11485 [Micrococcus luteus NCTC 2665]
MPEKNLIVRVPDLGDRLIDRRGLNTTCSKPQDPNGPGLVPATAHRPSQRGEQRDRFGDLGGGGMRDDSEAARHLSRELGLCHAVTIPSNRLQ